MSSGLIPGVALDDLLDEAQEHAEHWWSSVQEWDPYAHDAVHLGRGPLVDVELRAR